jgi:branched-chain amino acid transport system permease protein
MDFFFQQTVNGLVMGSVFSLYALGFSMVFASMHAFHVAHAGVFTWGAIFSWKLTTSYHWGFAPTVFAVAVLTGFLNVLTYFLAIRHLEYRKDRDLAIFVSSLGMGTVLTALALNVLKNVSVRLPFNLFSNVNWDLHIVRISNLQLLMLGTTIAVFFFLRWLLTRTQFGREMRAVAHDRNMAAVLGVNVQRVSLLVFFLSGAIAGIGAALVALAYNVVEGGLGQNYLVLAIAILVIGGLGSVIGAFSGGLLVGLVSAYTIGYITSSYRDVVVFGLLLLFLIVRPTGLFKTTNVLGRT